MRSDTNEVTTINVGETAADVAFQLAASAGTKDKLHDWVYNRFESWVDLDMLVADIAKRLEHLCNWDEHDWFITCENVATMMLDGVEPVLTDDQLRACIAGIGRSHDRV